MTGTPSGGRKAAETRRQKYGEDFDRQNTSKGGKAGHTGGFASDKVGKDGLTGVERAKIAGRKGRRVVPNKKDEDENN